MSINIQLEVQDVNTVLEGLQRVGDNAARVANIVREQGSAQFEAQQAAAQDAAKAAGQVPAPEGAAPQA